MSLNSKENLQEIAVKYLLPYLYIHIPIVWLTGFMTGNETLWQTILVAVFALVPTVSYKIVGLAALTRFLTSTSFMLIVGTLVQAFQGHEWQLDIHMYFFAGLAMLLVFADWRVYIVATTVIALHHLILNFAIPSWVFPNGGDFFRVVLHAVIVILETAVLTFATLKLTDALSAAETAQAEAHENHQRALQAIEEQKKVETSYLDRKSEEMRIFATQFEEEVGSIVRNVYQSASEIQSLGQSMSNAADQLNENSNNASGSTSSIALNAEAVAAASEQLSASVNEVSRQVNMARDITLNASELGSNTTTKVTSLSQKVTEIADVVNLITGIADQTNLLALNATIESARAGEAGKGFAVVANEVKNLASQTAQATEQIGQQINAVVTATDETVRSIDSINQAILEVQDTSTTIEESIREQDNATQEIATKAAETAQDVSSVSINIDSVKMDASSNIETISQVMETVTKLHDQASALDTAMAQFVEKLKR